MFSRFEDNHKQSCVNDNSICIKAIEILVKRTYFPGVHGHLENLSHQSIPAR